MTFSLVFDDVSLLLTLTIILLLSLTIYIGKGYQPLVHPLILSRQSDISPIRHKGQSAIYRNASSPSGLELASKPRRKINGVLEVLQSGLDSPEWSSTAKKHLYGHQKSNQDVINTARSFAQGLLEVTGINSISDLRVAICVEVDSLESFEVIIAGSVQAKSSQAFTPLIIHPSLLADQNIVLDGLPSSLKQSHAIFTTATSLSAALRLPTVNKDTIIIVASEQEAQSSRTFTSHKVMLIDEVLARSSSNSFNSVSEEESSKEGASNVHSYYYTEKARWVEVTNASLIAALTAHLAFYPAQSQPSKQDHINVAITPANTENAGASSPHLSAAYHPAGLVLPLLALYTGAAFSTSTLTRTTSPNISDATLLFTSPYGASILATVLCKLSKRNLLVRLASISKLAFLRHGTFSSSTIWDKLVFNNIRKSIQGVGLRSVLIVTESNSVNQDLLDILRIQLSCTVRQAYLPLSPCTAMGSELTSGIGSESSSNSALALVTAPLNAVHSLDLQAFAEEEHEYTPAHVGPPNVAVEMKLVETALFNKMDFKDAQIGQDSIGEILVRGHTLSGVHDWREWCATGDIGSFRSNGTLVILRPSQTSRPVYIPFLSSSSKKKKRRIQGTSTASIIHLLTVILCFFLCLSQVEAGILETQFLQSQVNLPLNNLYKRSNEINSTMVETAIMGFLSAPRAAWEQGCSQSALLEYYSGSWSVFSNSKGGPQYNQSSLSSSSSSSTTSKGLSNQLLSMAYSSIRSQDSSGKLCTYITGDEVTTQGSALDSASCGEGVLLAAFANGNIQDGSIANSNGMYIQSAQNQLHYVLNVVPRGASGIISMRSNTLAYWSDAMYMMPPFLALYGLMTRNQTLLQESYTQISLYRDELLINSGPAQGLLMHIVNGSNPSGTGNDRGAWLTGNGWAAAGMVKVIATIAQSEFASDMQSQIDDLVSWTQAILDGCYRYADPLIPNYVNDTTTFRDAAGSSLIAYATFRLASLSSTTNNSLHLNAAEAIYQAVQGTLTPIATFTDGAEVVNALTFTSPAQMSPESLAFLVLLSSAKRDHQKGNVTGINGSDSGYQGTSSRLQIQGWTICLLLAPAALALLIL